MHSFAIQFSGQTKHLECPAIQRHLKLTRSPQITTNTWDYENQLIRTDLPTGAVVTMPYNAINRRVWKDTYA